MQEIKDALKNKGREESNIYLPLIYKAISFTLRK
jgi:hypothetical protein